MRDAVPRFESTLRIAAGLALSLLAVFAFAAVPASAAYLHPTSTGAFGPDGTESTTFTGWGQVAIDQAGDHLFVHDLFENKVYGFDLANSNAPLGGHFPLSVSPGGEHLDLAVDNTGLGTAGNLYFLAESNSNNGEKNVLEGFDSNGTPLGGNFPLIVPTPARFCGLAVDPNGDIWISDRASKKILQYSAAGQPLKGAVNTAPQGGSCDLAFDSSSGDLYAEHFSSPIQNFWKYTASSGYKIGTELSDTSAPDSLAVDSQHGILYAAGGFGGGLAGLNADGVVLEQFPGGTGVDIDEATGTAFVMDSTFGARRVRVVPGVVIPDVVTEGVADTTVSAHVDSAGGGDVTSCIFEYGTKASRTEPYESSVPCSPAAPFSGPTAVSADLPGLSREVLYHYRVRAGNANGTNVGLDRTVIPHYVVDLKTEPATPVGKHDATLKASFTGTGLSTHYYFEWGPTTSYGTKTATPPGDDAGFGSGPQSISTPLTGLQSDTTYHYRVIATNSGGTSTGLDRTFTTVAAVTGLTTDGVTGLTGSTATLHGTWTGEGASTQYYFQWGFSPIYNQTSPMPAGDGGSGVGPQSVSVPLTDLLPAAIYHYRIVATNPDGTSLGEDRTFTTPQLAASKYLPVLKLTTGSAEVRGTVNPQSTGSTTYHFDYGTDTSYGSSTPESASVGSDNTEHSASAVIEGLAPGTAYHYRLVATSPTGIGYGTDQTLTTVPNLPTITESHTSEVVASGALLNAAVKPGFGPTVVYFQYGPTSSYGLATVASGQLPDDDDEHLVSSAISGLPMDTAFHYRAVASNFAGTSYGADRTFTTAGLPKLGGSSVSNVTRTTATLNAEVNPSLAPTTYHFEFSADSSFGSSSPETSLGAVDSVGHPISVTLTGLSPSTTYHYRLIATNLGGLATGGDQVFTTAAERIQEPPPPPPKCRKGKVRRHGKCVKKRTKKSGKNQTRKGR